MLLPHRAILAAGAAGGQEAGFVILVTEFNNLRVYVNVSEEYNLVTCLWRLQKK